MFNWYKRKGKVERRHFWLEDVLGNLIMFGLPIASFILLAVGTLLDWGVWNR